MSGFVPILGQRRNVLFWVCNCGFEVWLSHTASRSRQTAQNKQHIHHIVGVVALSAKMRSLQQTFRDSLSPCGP